MLVHKNAKLRVADCFPRPATRNKQTTEILPELVLLLGSPCWGRMRRRSTLSFKWRGNIGTREPESKDPFKDVREGEGEGGNDGEKSKESAGGDIEPPGG
jgi:hypothetical protein